MHSARVLAGSCCTKLTTKCLVQQTFSKYQSSAVFIQNLLWGAASFTLIDDLLTRVFDLVVLSFGSAVTTSRNQIEA